MPPAPATQGRPMPRATTAAWLVMPPRVVRMPLAACMPWMSSGLVSMRTRMTASPFFPRHVDGDLERGFGGALPVARLQHVELVLLHRELDVLHVAVVPLQRLPDL